MKRKRGNVKGRQKISSMVGGNANHAGVDDFDNVEFDSRMEAESPHSSTNMSGWQTDLEKLVNKITKDNANSLRKMNIAVSGNLSKKAENTTTKLSRGFGNLSVNSIGNAALVQGEITRQEEPRLPDQDPRYKEQELNAALVVIKKIMKMDDAGPFNVPVNPIALGIRDYFDVIHTPMDFGTIRNNLEKGLKYTNSEDVLKDVQYIWENCCKYNQKHDYILELMKRVKKNFMKYWAAAGLDSEQPQAINGYLHLSPPTGSTMRLSKRGKECPEGQMGLSQVRPHQPILILTQAHQPQLNSNQQRPSLQQADVDIGTADFTRMQRRTRGPTRCLSVWNKSGRIAIATNELGEPIGLEAPKLTNFLGTVARDGLMAPLTYVDWRAMPDANKEKMWQKVELKFDIDPESKSWVMKSLGKKWKDWKSKLKAARYNTHTTNEERLADRDERVLPDQWSILVRYWNLEEVEERSAKNKVSRAQQKFSHTTGTKSFARVREEQANKPYGKEPSQAELEQFRLTCTRKDGQPVNEGSPAITPQLRECTTKQQETLQDSRRPQDDILSQVMGQDRHGCVHPLPLGPSSSGHGVPKPIRAEAIRMVSGANVEVHDMKERMVAMEQACAKMASQMAAMMSMMSSMLRTPPNVDADTSGASEGL